MMFAFGFIEILILAFIAGLVVLFVSLGKRGRVILAICAVIPVLVVVLAVLASIVLPVVARHRSIHFAESAEFNVGGPNSSIVSMDSNGMRVATPSGTVSMGADGMNVTTSSGTVDMGPSGIQIIGTSTHPATAPPSAPGTLPPPPEGLNEVQRRVWEDYHRTQAENGARVLEEQQKVWSQAIEQEQRIRADAMSKAGLAEDWSVRPPGPSVALPSPEPWKSAADLGFAADLHPSMAAAAESLTVEILKLKDATHAHADIKRVQVWAAEDVDSQAVSRVVNRLQRKAPDWMVMVEALEPQGGDAAIEANDGQAASLRLEIPKRSTTHRAAWDNNREERGGVLRMRLSFKGGSIDRSTTFADKPWVENTSEFISSSPQARWVVGYSSPTATDRAEAHQQALRSAAAQILPEVRSQLQGRASFDDRWLLSAIERELSNAKEVRDRFVQTLIVNSGGQIVREAVLVQSGGVVLRVKGDVLAHVREQAYQVRALKRTWVATLGAAAGMCLLICVVGVLLNAITKGYYRGRVLLAVGMVLLLVVGSLAVASSHRQGICESVHAKVFTYADQE